MQTIIRPAVTIFVALTLLTGVAYPLLVTSIGRLMFSEQARGSVILVDGKQVGSSLIAQPFASPRYFWPRPSSAGANGYDASASSGSNLGPSNPALAEVVEKRIAALRAADPTNALPIPVDLVTASGSGLDPQISVAAATYQLARVARARNLPPAEVQRLIDAQTDPPALGVLGEARVNVLKLNLSLDHPPATTRTDEGFPGPITALRARGFLPK